MSDCVHMPGEGTPVEFNPPEPPQLVVVPIAGPKGAEGPPGAGAVDLEAHINSPNPHPVYDDAHSYRLIFENALL